VVKKNDLLKKYKQRRDFKKSPEPQDGKLKRKIKHPIFVIQEHDASHLHYDFRLEIDGVLKSWAIPKGPSTNPKEKRLAIETEDHPISYATFEGVIPEGYGAGTVMVWDIGIYENLKGKKGERPSMADCYKNGKIEVSLHGKKLDGSYALIKTHFRNNSHSWLFFKMKDDQADVYKKSVALEKNSALTGRSLKEIADDEK
jgi:DNA ligase D-like protein (predicted 3'-phosphoesterase)